MRVGVVCQARNEGDVLPAFLAHIAAFADDAVLMDHGSVDGSDAMMAEACRGRPGWVAWRIVLRGHHQAAFASLAAARLFGAGVDYVVFLDADEFLDVPDRAAVHTALAQLERPGDVGIWTWRDCVPDRLSPPFGHDDPIWRAPAPSRYTKAVLSRTLFRASGGRAGPAMGAHAIERAGLPTRDVRLGTILHLPLRSAGQMRRKVVLASLAERARPGRAPTDNSHWAEALLRLAVAPLGDDDVRGTAARYGEPGAASSPLGLADLPQRGFTLGRLTVAHAGPVTSSVQVEIEPWRMMADALRDWAPEPLDGMEVVETGGVVSAQPCVAAG